MVDVICEWAGKDRLFRLTFGGVMDLEEAVGEGIGRVFLDVASSRFRVRHVYHTLRLGLIGGGLDVLAANNLMKQHFDTRPLMENATVAGQILAALMTGVEETAGDVSGDVPPPHRFSEVSQICRVFHMSPADLRAMRYADFVNMLRGYNAGAPVKAPHLTEEEFLDVLARYEPEALAG